MPDRRKTQDYGRLAGFQPVGSALWRRRFPRRDGMALAETEIAIDPRPRAAAESARDTFPKLLLENARVRGERPAIREKDFGIWQSWSWSQAAREVQDFALGLAALGFKRGDKLGVIGDNRPRLYWAQVAAQCLGGASVPVYQDSIAKELAFVWNHADVSVIVADDQEQIDKVMALRDQL